MTNGFITKIDISNNRQVKQDVLSDTILSGSTTLGVEFSQLPHGPNKTTSGITESFTAITGTFSGNTGTTVFIFNDNRLNLGVSKLTVITPLNSGITQTTGSVYTGNTTTIIDGNLVNLDYSGVSYSLNVTTMEDIGGNNYTGATNSTNVKILSASTLDYTGRTIWCSIPGILNVDNKIETNGLNILTSITPTGTTDSVGDKGSITWDDNYFYVKTNNGWGRTSLSGF